MCWDGEPGVDAIEFIKEFDGKLKEVRRLRKNIKDWNLSVPDSFNKASDGDLAQAYNGAGPDRWPAVLRAIITFFLRRFREAVLVHDFRFDQADGTRDGFDEANEEMWTNMKKTLDVKYPYWFLKPLYWFWWKRAYAAHLAILTDECFESWTEAAKKRSEYEKCYDSIQYRFPNTADEKKILNERNNYRKNEYRDC